MIYRSKPCELNAFQYLVDNPPQWFLELKYTRSVSGLRLSIIVEQPKDNKDLSAGSVTLWPGHFLTLSPGGSIQVFNQVDFYKHFIEKSEQ